MRTHAMQQAAEFFARLANIPDWDALSAEERAAVLADLHQLMPQEVAQTLTRFREFFLHPEPAWQLPRVLGKLHPLARQMIRNLLVGQRVLLGEYILTGELKDGVMVETRLSPEEEDPYHIDYTRDFETRLYQLLQLRPFPFGLCSVCHKVFVQPGRGKPRRFCSVGCKQRGIPSAARHTAYARTWRHRVRAQEIDTTRRILRAWPEERAYWERLRREFPRKSRRQLLYLVKLVRNPNQEEAGSDRP